LFDMDGTLLGEPEHSRRCFDTGLTSIDSTPAVLATWEFYAKEYNLDLTEVLKSRSPDGLGPIADHCSFARSANQRQHEELVWNHRRCSSRCGDQPNSLRCLYADSTRPLLTCSSR
jgi:beta-phosphoglucomutase-like phosphatase (HAD superfamily)